MQDSTTYGKTKAQIVTALSGVEGWSTGGGADVAGYEIALLPYLTDVTRDADKSVTTLFESGMGVDGNAYTITNWTQLQNINYAWFTKNKNYILSNNISSATAGYIGTGEGWNPIGTFEGAFDGQGNSISDLYINRPNAFNQALFGQTEDATIANVNLVNVDIKGKTRVGALVGTATTTHVENVSSSGTVVGENDVGGLVGYMAESSMTILKSHSSADVSGVSNVGGLVGNLSWSSVKESYATGKVTGTSNSIGGLVGNSDYSEIENSYATGEVSGTGQNIGGLVGHNSSDTIQNSYATGKVSGTGVSSLNVGGLVGSNEGAGSHIKNSYATGEVSGVDKVGGLVGYHSSADIANSYAIGKVTAGAGASNVGGLVGNIYELSVTNSFFDKDTTSQTYGVGNYPYPQGVTGKTTAQMKDKTTFNSTTPSWDIEEDSTVEKGTPFLAWQTAGNTYTKTWVIGTKSAAPDPVDPTPPDPKPDPVDPTPPDPKPDPVDPTPPDPKPDPVDPTPPDPKPDPVIPPKPEPVVPPKPEPKPQEKQEIKKVVDSITSQTAVKVNLPVLSTNVKTDVKTFNNSGKNVNVAFSAGENKMIVSKPIEGQVTQKISLSEAKQMQKDSGSNSEEVRVPLSNSSIIELVDGGVTLPDGVEQEFYVAQTK